MPQLYVDVDRVKAKTLGVPLGDVFSTLQTYLGSTYVNDFNKFGRTFQVYVQADQEFRLKPEDIEDLDVRNSSGRHGPARHAGRRQLRLGPSLITRYNLYPAATINGAPAAGFSSGQALRSDGADRRPQAATRHGLRLDGHVLPGEAGRRADATSSSRSASCWSTSSWRPSTRAGSRRSRSSWWCRWRCWGPSRTLAFRGIDNNIYTQIGIDPAHRAGQQERDPDRRVRPRARLRDGEPILEAAVDASRLRFRPILMTSFAFILGVLPLVIATGAGASARQSLGTAVFGGMIASTCLAVFFVPSFFVVLQRFEEWRAARKAAREEKAAAARKAVSSAG